MTDSQKLLTDYVTNGSETAFRELVTRYTDLVYSTAVRLASGDAQLAQDVAQAVFIDLARMARTLSGEVMLGGWLHRHTRFVAATVMRGERRRQSRERQAAEMSALRNESDCNLAWVSLQVDEAIDTLATEDRAALILRFFEQADLRSVGEALGISENAARMRVTRALEKLHSLLKRRGARISATALAAALGAEAVTAAPAGFAASFATSALAGATAGAGTPLMFAKLISMTKVKFSIIGAIVAASVATPLWVQHRSLSKASEENEALRQQVEQLAQVAADNERLSNSLAQAKSPPGSDQVSELLRLRGEVGGLRRQLADAVANEKRRAALSQQQQVPDPMEQQKEMGISKMNYTKGWMLALMQYADQHDGQFPTNFDLAASFLPGEMTGQTNLAPNQFEIVYKGSVNDITNPQSVIVIREKEAWPTFDGGWVRDYSFADGHSEIHKAVNGDFQTWEAQHIVAAPVDGQAGR